MNYGVSRLLHQLLMLVMWYCSGLTSPQQQHSFRAEHPMYLKVGYAVKQAPPQLPSDKKPEFTYGKPSTHKTMEEIRVAG